MRLLLIEPTNKHAGLRTEFRVPSLVLELLATLTPPDWDVRIIQEPFESVDFDEEVDLVGITVVTNTANRAYQIADEYRKRDKKVVMGGIHPTILPHSITVMPCVWVKAKGSGAISCRISRKES
jgi:hypothetical protein